MSHESACHETTFGYLSVLNAPEHGYFGGYLIVSILGRPLEFHCTAPVQPSRAQKILYGATLEPYLIGDQIAGSLLEAAKIRPALILVDHAASLSFRDRINVRMVLLSGNTHLTRDSFPPAEFSAGLDASSRANLLPPASYSSDGTFIVSSHNFQLPSGFEADRGTVIRDLTELALHVDLGEPFQRIEEAIREAQRLGGSGADSHDQAA